MSAVTRSACFTINNPTFDDRMAVDFCECRYIVYQEEVGEAGTLHLQGYMELEKPMRVKAINKLLGGRAHVEVRRGTRDEARNYCMKSETATDAPVERGDWGAGGQGRRTDLDGLMEAIRSGVDRREIFEAMPAVVARNLNFMREYAALVERDETRAFRKVQCHVLYGASDCGKSTIPKDLCPGIFRVNAADKDPFNSYDGEDAIMIDDFYGNMDYGHFLNVCDGHQMRVNVKYGHRYARWTKVFITSNDHPAQWYPKGFTPAMRRRFNSVTKFGNEEPGSTRPAPEIPEASMDDYHFGDNIL